MPTRSFQTAVRKLMLTVPRNVYRTALDHLDTPPRAAEFPIDAPWMAALHYDGGGRVDYFAGVGFVIAPDWVLTNAHLFCPAFDRPETGEPPTSEKTFYARIGDPRLGIGKLHLVAERVENNYVPAIGTPDSRKNRTKPCADLALLRLADPTDVEPAQLLAAPIPDGTAVSCLGWPGGPKGSGMLTQIDTTTIPRNAGLGGVIKSDEFCVANPAAPADMSHGCSGAPAAIMPAPGDRTPPLIVGIVSRGADIGDDTISAPVIVGDLTAHREFIEAATGITFLTAADLA